MSPFQATEKKIDDRPLQRILAAKPLQSSPAMPSLSTTASAASTYVMGTSDVWTAVLTTRVLFEFFAQGDAEKEAGVAVRAAWAWDSLPGEALLDRI